MRPIIFKAIANTSRPVSAKALELFIISLVTKAAAEATERSSKRVTAGHLKQAVMKDQTFDFLQEIIEKAPDNPDKKGGGGQTGSDDADEGDIGMSTKKQRGTTASRGRRKVESDDD